MFESMGMTRVSICKTDSYDIISLVDIHGCWHWSTLEYCNVPAFWKCPLWLHNWRSRMISKGSFWRTSHTKVDQARTSFAKKLGMKLATTYISNPFKFQWIQMILWCPKARGDPPSIPKFTWMGFSPLPTVVWLWSRQLLWDVSDFLRWGNSWDLKGRSWKIGTWKLIEKPQLNKLKCVRLMLFAIMK